MGYITLGTGSDWLRKLVEVSTGFFVGIEDKQKQEIITYYTEFVKERVGKSSKYFFTLSDIPQRS